MSIVWIFITDALSQKYGPLSTISHFNFWHLGQFLVLVLFNFLGSNILISRLFFLQLWCFVFFFQTTNYSVKSWIIVTFLNKQNNVNFASLPHKWQVNCSIIKQLQFEFFENTFYGLFFPAEMPGFRKVESP